MEIDSQSCQLIGEFRGYKLLITKNLYYWRRVGDSNPR